VTHSRLARFGRPHMKLRMVPAVALAALAWILTPAAAQAHALQYPDLRTLAPSDLRFDTVTYLGVTSKVLRFSNTVWNAGQGPLELHGTPDGTSAVTQRIFDDGGGFTDVAVGNDFTYHPGHNHFHFEDFAEYELWTKSDYDAWVASGRSVGQAQRVGSKTTFCVMDTGRVQSLPGTPSGAVYSQCGTDIQGLSVGWGDTYGWSLPEQWIDLGGAFLPNGTYVLRSIADPRNKLYESANRSDSARESAQTNEATTVFTVKRNHIRVTR
jgi:Lysyl oxidase